MCNHRAARLYWLIGCCSLLFRSAVAYCASSTLMTAGASQLSTTHCLYELTSQPVLLDDSEIVAGFQQKAKLGNVDAMNQLGIIYARGRGVVKDYRVALNWFRQSALCGYPPAMVNLGTMYEFGAGVHRNYRRAYAWIRVALEFGVPEKDHDAVVFRLGMIASRVSPHDAARAERLAGDIAENITKQCKMPTDRYSNCTNECSNN